jgi:hypothetical protein
MIGTDRTDCTWSCGANCHHDSITTTTAPVKDTCYDASKYKYIIHVFPLHKEDMKICTAEKSHISRGQRPREIWLFRGWANFISPLCKGNKCFIPPGQRFWWILPDEIFWPSLFTKLLFRNISGVNWIREIRYCREGDTMLLRGKYDALINVTWNCFDQSNFYISKINIIEWNKIIDLRTFCIVFPLNNRCDLNST